MSAFPEIPINHDWTIGYRNWQFGLAEMTWGEPPATYTEIRIGPLEMWAEQPITTMALRCGCPLLISAAMLAFAVARFIRRPQADRGDANRKKPGWLFWTTVVAAALLSYPLSYGPWLKINRRLPESVWHTLERAYDPLWPAVWGWGPDWLIEPYLSYLELWDESEIFNLIRERRANG